MKNELDRPLGVKAKNFGWNQTPWIKISGLIVLFGVLGVGIYGGYISQTQPTSNSVSGPILDNSKAVAVQNDSKFTKRPDLPNEEIDGGLRELTPNSSLDGPVIVPKRRPDNIRQKKSLAYIPDGDLVEKSKFGLLPRRSSDGLRPMDVYSRQPDTEGNFGVARIILIVGGMGLSQTSTQQAIKNLPAGVTFAFAPYGNSLSRWMQLARRSGHELLMQLPMEPFGYPQITAGDHSLLTTVSAQKNNDELHWNLGRITNYVGVMNHLGGKLMTTPEKLKPILSDIADRGLLFVDNGSVKNSAANETAKSIGLPFARAHLTIDNIRSRRNIQKRLIELETLAKRTGLAIGIATAFPDSITAISRFLRDAKSRGLELTPVSAIVSKPKE